MKIIFEIVEKTTIFDWTTFITAIISLILSFVSLRNTLNETKRDKNNRKIDMEANYYSYPILEKNEHCEVIIPTDSLCVIAGNIDDYNILNIQGHEIKDDYTIQLSLKFKNLSKIYPDKVLINNLTLFYSNEDFNGERILKKFAYFNSIDNKEKIVFIDGDGYLHFKIKCLIDKKTQEEIIDSLEKDTSIQFSFGIYFQNVFNVITEGKYNVSLTKKNIKRKGTSSVLGSNQNCYEFNTEIVQYQNTSIYYAENSKIIKKFNSII